jgi:hypothetical protein
MCRKLVVVAANFKPGIFLGEGLEERGNRKE